MPTTLRKKNNKNRRFIGNNCIRKCIHNQKTSMQLEPELIGSGAFLMDLEQKKKIFVTPLSLIGFKF